MVGRRRGVRLRGRERRDRRLARTGEFAQSPLSAIRTLGSSGAVTALRFGEDGRTLYSVSPGGLYAWDLTGSRGIGARAGSANDASLPGLACALAGRDLTAAEWIRYLPGQPYRQVC
jgi:hypothetical protein